MATQTLKLHLLLLIIIFTTLSTSHARPIPIHDVNFIQNTCKNTQNPSFCVSTLQSDKRSINVTTVDALAGISLGITVSDAESTLSTINDLAEKSPGTALEEDLHVCAQLYSNAIDDLHDAIDQLNSKEYDAAATTVDQAGDAPDSCEAAFTDGVKSPVTDRDKRVTDLCGLSVDLLDLLSS
ncbi:hypothetical protein J5N97_026956 [Dioscorea zingiberensis]|uniref:Pectinesterase inhibitor domain-containing protein n=1 Tax=Dioscorea zingiberensis TaxID=325984 RepID=A0A9D5C437_9LILI|nr:hypothetical protein J5N97_026956 [Dioscorea zingiberensis]